MKRSAWTVPKSLRTYLLLLQKSPQFPKIPAYLLARLIEQFVNPLGDAHERHAAWRNEGAYHKQNRVQLFHVSNRGVGSRAFLKGQANVLS